MKKRALTLSADIVGYLQEERKLTLKQIGGLIDKSESFMCRIRLGQRNFRLEHLELLEKSLEIPIPLLILRARNESMPQKLQNFYDILKISF
ncbi:hypothetical protein KKC65_00740 [Patescibacteria group bacterium]|nr:hypothetical protein [Patescibacteria group bacterium]